ncbi:hypothetical protein CSUNSWCD_2245 [Campylobacter showae CSUNSWCD]|uniref:Uncharacterized protein n=1 Tax=Campylobacter showae CSUNSWCD TaxID=1244083 RepID=M5IFE1_9BACT|nr:hypothetical protein CSUNSWCD_2245 [Campylobacter showae CSUNSWCD]
MLRHQILLFVAPNLKDSANAIVKFNGSNLTAELINLTALNARIGSRI